MKILFVVSEDWYFCSHRLPLAEEALNRGWNVGLISRFSGNPAVLRDMAVRPLPLDLERGGLNLFKDLRYCWKLIKIYRSEKPDIVHHVAMKPCLYGSIAARVARVGYCVNAIAGFGTLFSSEARVMQVIRPLVMTAFRQLFGFRNCKLILQNPDDVYEFENILKLEPKQIRIIRGSGVNLELFHPADKPLTKGIPLIVMVSRLLKDKGVMELIDAAKILKDRKLLFRMAIVGDADFQNIHAVSEEDLQKASDSGVVELWGRRTDIVNIYQKADISVLPSYREGLPKTLIEAMACGLPIVTTDVPGCREVVEEGVNGYLVPVQQAHSLADALELLIKNEKLRRKMGIASRKKAEKEFGIDLVVSETFSLYEELLGKKPLMSKVLVTGADGFVGSKVCERLIADDVEVRRARRKAAPLADGCDAVVVGDIDASTNWSLALAGIDAVIHLAARVHIMDDTAANPMATFRGVNVDGTRCLAEESAKAGVKRFVFISSIKVNGEATLQSSARKSEDGRQSSEVSSEKRKTKNQKRTTENLLAAFSERDLPSPEDPYGRSKYEAEVALRKIEASTGMEVVILRPPLLYGPGVKGNFLKLIQLVDRGIPLPLGGVKNKRSLLSLTNFVDVISKCVIDPRAAGQTFMICDDEDVSSGDLVRRIAKALKTPPRLVPVPEWFMKLAGGMTGKSAQVQRLCSSLQVDSSHIQETLNWKPAVTMDEELLLVAEWYRSL